MNKDQAQENQRISAEPPKETGEEPKTYVYEPSGIREHTGHIPTWLKLVAVGLMAWGIYYAIRYWSAY